MARRTRNPRTLQQLLQGDLEGQLLQGTFEEEDEPEQATQEEDEVEEKVLDYLKPLRGKIRRRRFLVMDIEAKDGDSQKAGFTRPFLVGTFDGETFRRYYDKYRGGDPMKRYYYPGGCVAEALEALLVPEHSGKWIYSHYGGGFDMLHLLAWFRYFGGRRGFVARPIPIQSSILMIEVTCRYNKNLKWTFLDSIRLLPGGLADIGKLFDVGAKLVDHDLNLPEWDPAWGEYLKADCVVLYRALQRFHSFITDKLGGEVGVTLPSTAMMLFRRQYLKMPIARVRESHALVREGLCGGRTEAFIREGFNLTGYDINSSYPFSMLEFDMPAGEGFRYQGEPSDAVKEQYIGFVRCNVHVPEEIFGGHLTKDRPPPPPLPVRGRREDGLPEKLLFPIGRLHGVWEYSELQMALEMGCTIEDWFESVWFQPRPIFREYVSEIYLYRDVERDGYQEFMAAIAKNLLNSTFGKFAQKVERTKIYIVGDPDMPEDAVPANPYDPNCLVYYAQEKKEAAYIVPQISARVTSLSRQALYRGMLAIRGLGGQTFYTDTDSLHTNTRLESMSVETFKPWAKGMIGNNLGQLKAEYERDFPGIAGTIHGRYFGPKLYHLESDVCCTNASKGKLFGKPFDKVKAKGLSGKDLEGNDVRTRENFERFVAGTSIFMMQLEKIGTLAQLSFERGPRMRVVKRSWKQGGEKRRWLEDGTSMPHVVNLWRSRKAA